MRENKLSSPIETVTWINAKFKEKGFRKLASFVLGESARDPSDFQTYIPAQDIPVLRSTNPDLADCLDEQLNMKRMGADRVLFPVVESNGNIKITYTIPKKPLGVRFTVNGPVEIGE